MKYWIFSAIISAGLSAQAQLDPSTHLLIYRDSAPETKTPDKSPEKKPASVLVKPVKVLKPANSVQMETKDSSPSIAEDVLKDLETSRVEKSRAPTNSSKDQ